MSGAVETVTVAGDDEPLRLDRWFHRHYPGLGHGRLEQLLRKGQIRVDGRRAKAGDRVVPGQAIRIPPLDAAPPATPRVVGAADAAMLHQAVIHRDATVIVLNKPPGLAVQGGTRSERHLDGLLDALRFGSAERPRLVHRLDKETSGVLVIARSAAAAAFLARAFRDKTTQKLYWALTVGVARPPQGRIGLALAKGPGTGGSGRGGERVRADPDDGKPAVTYYHTLDTAGERASWLALRPVTGRTHQLRVHCAAIGTPILGDAKYGGLAAQLAGAPNMTQLHLHARALSIPLPQGGRLQVTAPLPSHMRQSWDFFGFPGDVADPFAELDGAR
ncbi:MAG: RluA family pseudouridine synthase [Stellaceae bacterium]